jgi:transketolase
VKQNEFRDILFGEINRIAAEDGRVIVLTADMGATELDKFKESFRERYINVGIAEQSGISIAAGLALGGKIVFVYGIIPFITLRCLEQIKVDLCIMKLPVTIIGIGAGSAYGADGPTHHAIEDIAVMRALPEMTIFSPSDPVSVEQIVRIVYAIPGPKYIRLDKGSYPSIHKVEHDFSVGLAVQRKGEDVTIISTGTLVHKALAVSDELAKHAISSSVVDLYRIKPVNDRCLLRVIEGSKLVVTLEDHSIIGGIGSIISEVLADNHVSVPVKRIGINDQYSFRYGNKEWLHSLYGLDVNTVTKVIYENLMELQK